MSGSSAIRPLLDASCTLATSVSDKTTYEYNDKFYSEMVSNDYNLTNNGIPHSRNKVRM